VAVTRPSVDRSIALLAFAAILVHLGMRVAGIDPHLARVPLYIALGVGAPFQLIGLSRHLIRGEFAADLLAGISIVTSIVVGEYLAGVIIVLMLSGGNALEFYALRRASAVLDALARRSICASLTGWTGSISRWM